MKVVIAAAGTGGHINPGIAIAGKIKEMDQRSDILFIGTNRGLENDLVPRAGYKLRTIRAYGIERKLTLQNIKRLYYTAKSIGEAKKILREFGAEVVIGTGGYICMPVMIAAKKLGIPRLLHESNAFPGVSVKLLSKNVNTVMVGFEDAIQKLPKANKVVVTGNPTKIKKREFSDIEKANLIKQMGLKTDKPIVLVFGGSQGAQSINQSFLKIITKKQNTNYQIMWAAGPLQYEEIKQVLKKEKLDIDHIENVKIVPYIYNMEEVLNVVDLVVCRSGAMTITEIAIVGKPAIFIPFPYATENHQEYNAKVLEKVGAAKIILDKDLNADILHQEIESIITSKQVVQEMGAKANLCAVSQVEDKIYHEIELVKKINLSR